MRARAVELGEPGDLAGANDHLDVGDGDVDNRTLDAVERITRWISAEKNLAN